MKKVFTYACVLLVMGFVMPLSSQGQTFPEIAKKAFPPAIAEMVFGQVENAQSRAPGLPQKTHEFYWEAAAWIEDLYIESVYLPNGMIQLETNFDPVTLEPLERTTFTYNPQGWLVEMLVESYETGSWENALKVTITYDAHGNLHELIYAFWTGGGWMEMFGYRSTFTYTPQNYVSAVEHESYDFMSGWEKIEKEIYTLTGSGIPTEILFQMYNGAWVDSTHRINIDWYEYDPMSGYGMYEYFEDELWDGSAWNLYMNETTVYDANGGWVLTQQLYEGGWVNSFRETMELNDQGLTVLFTYEMWQARGWVLTYGSQYLYTFSGENLTQEIIKGYNTGTQQYENQARYDYSDFFYPTGNEERVDESSIQVYPNPVSDIVIIQVNDISESSGILEIIDYAGQLIYSENVEFNGATVHTLTLDAYPDGMYLLRIITPGQVIVKSILKR